MIFPRMLLTIVACCTLSGCATPAFLVQQDGSGSSRRTQPKLKVEVQGNQVSREILEKAKSQKDLPEDGRRGELFPATHADLQQTDPFDQAMPSLGNDHTIMAAGAETSGFPASSARHESNRQFISQLKPLSRLETKPVPSNQRDLLTGAFPSRQSAQSGDFQQTRQKPNSAAPKSPGIKKLPSIQELEFSLGGIMSTTSNQARAMLKTNRLETFIVKTGSQIRVTEPGQERTFSVVQIESSCVFLRDLTTKKQIRVD